MPIGSKRMSALYKGRNVATRPIPRDVWTDEARELAAMVVQKAPREAPQFGRRGGVNAPQLSGRRVRSAVGGAGFNPAQSNAKQR